VLRYQLDADTELLYGYVTDAGQLMGSFLSAAVLTSTGAIRRYQTFFHTGFQLLDFPQETDGLHPSDLTSDHR
jgi:hypothetical protein